jgi:hypothetical protein
VSQECITAYNDLKLSKKHKYIVFKLSDDNKEIVVEEASSDGDWEVFREKLINATSKSKSVRGTSPGRKRKRRRRMAVSFHYFCRTRNSWPFLVGLICGIGRCRQGTSLRCLRLRVLPLVG